MLKFCAALQHKLDDRVGEILFVSGAFVALDQSAATVLFSNHQYAREAAALCSIGNELQMNRHLEAYAFRYQNKGTVRQQRGVQRNENLGHIVSFLSQMLPDDLVIPWIADRVGKIGRHYRIRERSHR
jgi:hypothetical protein